MSSIKESTDTVKWREMIDIDHQPKQLDHQVEGVACHQYRNHESTDTVKWRETIDMTSIISRNNSIDRIEN